MNESYYNNVALNLYTPENEDAAEKYAMTRISLMLSEINLINNNKERLNNLQFYSQNITVNNEERTTSFIYETLDNLFEFQSNRSLGAYLN